MDIRDASNLIDEEQIKVLTLMNKKLQGKTVKLQNHNNPKKQNGLHG